MKQINTAKQILENVAIINPISNSYAPHRKYARLFSRLKISMGSNLFVSPTTLLLATLLKKIGCQPRIYNDVEEKVDPSKVEEPTILITIMTATARRGYEIARLFRDRRIIIGGVHASILPEEAIQYADQVVVGECESVLLDLIAGRTKERIVHGKPIADLDDVPHLDCSFLRVLPEIVPLQTSRGCPFNCSFCSVSKIYGRKCRFRSPANVLAGLTSYREKYGEINKIDFRLEADFTRNLERAKDILRRMLGEGIKPKVTVSNSRIYNYKDKELLSLMSQLNFKIYVGIESLSQDVLNNYSKKQQISDIDEAIRVFHDHNIKVHGYFIFGADQDEPDTLKHYEDFIHESKLDTFNVSVLTPFPGTELYNQMTSQKRVFTFNWDYYDALHFTFKPAKKSAHEMQKAFNDFSFRVFSLRRCLNPKLLFDTELLKYKFFSGLMSRMLKKDLIGYANLLRKHSHTDSIDI